MIFFQTFYLAFFVYIIRFKKIIQDHDRRLFTVDNLVVASKWGTAAAPPPSLSAPFIYIDNGVVQNMYLIIKQTIKYCKNNDEFKNAISFCYTDFEQSLIYKLYSKLSIFFRQELYCTLLNTRLSWVICDSCQIFDI